LLANLSPAPIPSPLFSQYFPYQFRALRTGTRKINPGAFLCWIRLLVILYVAGIIFLCLNMPLPEAVLATLGPGIMIGEFFYYHEVIDFLFPCRIRRNVPALVELLGEVRGRLIISGHNDCTPIFNFLVHQPNLYSLLTVDLSADLVTRCQRLFAASVKCRPNQLPFYWWADTAELASSGIQAITLIGMPWDNDERSSVYHIPGDVLEAVSLEALSDAIDLCLALARDLDGEMADISF
jgi:hypothetical protein